MRDANPAIMELPSGGALHVDGPGDAPDAAPALLFLHGVGGAAWSWRPQRAAFAATNAVYVWEARGHGAAAHVDDAGLADYYTDAREALAAVVAETHGPAVLVAHSMGGLLAFALASDYPESVKGLFLVDPVYASGEEYGHFSPRTGKIARALCSPLLRSFQKGGLLSRIVARWVFVNSFEDRTRMEAAWADQREQIPFEYPRMLDESFGRPVGFELRDFAAELNAPVALIEGTPVKGRMRFPKLIESLTRRLGANFRHEVIAGGHYLQLDRPLEVNARLATFMARYA